MAEMKEARAPEMQEAAPKSLHHVEITAHYHSGGRPKRESHTFGKDEHAEMAAHIAEHFPEVAQHLVEQHAGPETVEEAASEPASEDVHA